MRALVHGVRTAAHWMEQPGVSINVLAIVLGSLGVICSILGMFMMVEADQKMSVASFTEFTTSQQMLGMALRDVIDDAPAQTNFAGMSNEAQKKALDRTMHDLSAQLGNVALRNSPDCLSAWNDLYGFVYVVLNGGFSDKSPQQISDSYFDKQENLKKQCSSVANQ